jgi:hypothetical protein
MTSILPKWIFLTIFFICCGCTSRQPIAEGRTPTELIPRVYSRKVQDTFFRHYHELLQLPGVVYVVPDGWDIQVYTDNPTVVPREIEGVSIVTFPADKRPPPPIEFPH